MPPAFEINRACPFGRRVYNFARLHRAPPDGQTVARTKIPDFEQSLGELERLVSRLEEGDLALEEAMKTFERGVELTRQCQTALQTAQQKVEILLERSGRLGPEPFEPEPLPSAAGGTAGDAVDLD